MSTSVNTYPFGPLDRPAFRCKKKCGALLRYCNLHQRTYEVVEGNESEILRNKQHKCSKAKSWLKRG